MLQRSPFALQWCPALRRRWAPQNNSCAFHRMWNTTRGSLRSRSAAKRCASPCSTSVIGGQKHELDAIVYFDLLFRFSCPRQFRDRWLRVAGRRATRNMSCSNQSGRWRRCPKNTSIDAIHGRFVQRQRHFATKMARSHEGKWRRGRLVKDGGAARWFTML